MYGVLKSTSDCWNAWGVGKRAGGEMGCEPDCMEARFAAWRVNQSSCPHLHGLVVPQVVGVNLSGDEEI